MKKTIKTNKSNIENIMKQIAENEQKTKCFFNVSVKETEDNDIVKIAIG